MTAWLIQPEALKPLDAAMARGIVPTAEQLIAFEALYGDDNYPGARIMSKAGNVARIEIFGALTRTPSWMARYFGGGNTAYTEILSALAEAERDPNIKSVELAIDSPGGQTSGLVEVMDAVYATTKPTKAIVVGTAASAAYGIASQADTIVAENRGVMVGSIGVKATLVVYENVVEITSTHAPDKAPDITTDAGKATVRGWLDDIEAIFIEDIARGRGTTAEKVKSDFGKGGVFLADNAKKNGMIDEIQSAQAGTGSARTTTTQEANLMDLHELKAKHPTVYAEAVKIGEDKERDRVGAHLTMGHASGDMTTAIAACKDGTEMTATLQATYMAASMNRADVTARGTDEQAAAAAATITAPAAAADDIDAFADLMRTGG